MKKIKSRFLAGGLAMLLMVMAGFSGVVYAEGIPNGLSVSPPSDKIVLAPGDKYSGEVTVSNPSTTGEKLSYEAHVDSFFVDDDYTIALGTENDYTKMKDWITLSNEKGTIEAGGSAKIKYKIIVPDDAPAGGQYAAVVVATTPSSSSEGTTISEVWQIASVIYASISGSSVLSGEVSENSMPSFFLNPPIETSFMVKNTGNMHADATYYLQVYPLFSDEEVYTNEEDPGVSNIMPGTTRMVVSTWEGTPQVGIFKVVQVIKAFGNESRIEKYVIVCPIWLLFIIIFVVIMIVIWLVMAVRGRKKKATRADKSESREDKED